MGSRSPLKLDTPGKHCLDVTEAKGLFDSPKGRALVAPAPCPAAVSVRREQFGTLSLMHWFLNQVTDWLSWTFDLIQAPASQQVWECADNVVYVCQYTSMTVVAC